MTPELTITLIVIAIILAIYLLISYPLNKYLYRRFFRYKYYRTIYKIVNKKDYRLINNFYFKIDENSQAHFDHLLFGEKYIYCITDKYWTMGIVGKPHDESWLLCKTKDKRTYIDNPLLKNDIREEKLSLISGIERDMFVSIVIVNNDCVVNESIEFNKHNIIVKEKNLAKVIARFENEDIGKINEEQLQRAIFDLNKIKF